MRKNKRTTILFGLLFLIILVMTLNGCSWFSGPSDDEIIRAISDMELFSGGVEKFTLKSPIAIIDKDLFSRDGSWAVKVRLTYTYMMSGEKETKPIEMVQAFRITRSTDSSGNIVWKATSVQR